jgi:heme-degrading monooxygenase HmoA
MTAVYTMGSWMPNPGREEDFVAAWSEFAAWASSQPGAGTLRLVRNLTAPERFVSFGDWKAIAAVRAWKGSPEFKERMARVLQHVSEFNPTELELVATADEGHASRPEALVTGGA